MATAPAKALRSPEEVGPVSPIIAEGLPASEAVDRAALLESLRQALANPEESIESIFTAVAAAAQALATWWAPDCWRRKGQPSGATGGSPPPAPIRPSTVDGCASGATR